MPLEPGKSREAFSHNVSEMVKAGHPQKQALAAAYREQRGDEERTDSPMTEVVRQLEDVKRRQAANDRLGQRMVEKHGFGHPDVLKALAEGRELEKQYDRLLGMTIGDSAEPRHTKMDACLARLDNLNERLDRIDADRWAPPGHVSSVLGTDKWAVGRQNRFTRAQGVTMISPQKHEKIQEDWRRNNPRTDEAPYQYGVGVKGGGGKVKWFDTKRERDEEDRRLEREGHSTTHHERSSSGREPH